jgi:excisionase family DNA binding protein
VSPRQFNQRDNADVELLRLLFDGHACATINETATTLRITRDTVYALVAAGQLTMGKLGRRSIIHTPSIIRLLRETTVTLKPRARRSTTTAPTLPTP